MECPTSISLPLGFGACVQRMHSGVVPERPKQQTLRQLDVRESDYIQAVESGPSYITRALQSWGI